MTNKGGFDPNALQSVNIETGEYSGPERRHDPLSAEQVNKLGRLLTLYSNLDKAFKDTWAIKPSLVIGPYVFEISSTEAAVILRRMLDETIVELKKEGFDLPTPQEGGLTGV